MVIHCQYVREMPILAIDRRKSPVYGTAQRAQERESASGWYQRDMAPVEFVCYRIWTGGRGVERNGDVKHARAKTRYE